MVSGNNLVVQTTHYKSIYKPTVYNAEEAHLYVHHETFLPALPLCMEWLDFNPSDTKPGNIYFQCDMYMRLNHFLSRQLPGCR